MAQLNITLNQEEILLLLEENREDAFAKLLRDSLNSILKAESASQLQAEPYERSEERQGYRNGYRERTLNTRIGTIELKVPKHRDVPFHSLIFDNYCRSEGALVACMAEMVVNGVSTRKVERVVETLCGLSISKSAVSDLCKELDEEIREFLNRPLADRYPIVTLDATYFKVREERRTISKAFMIAYALNGNGRREVIGFGAYPNESKETWTEFLKDLNRRGLKDVRMFITDSHEGIKHGIAHVFPETPWQRCQFHFKRNILDKAPKKYLEGLRVELETMFNSKTIKEARDKRDAIISEYKDVAEKAMDCLDDGFEDSMTVMVLPENIRKKFRTSNHIERLNRELKRRSDVIGVFPNTKSLIRLMGAVLIERNEELQHAHRVIYETVYSELDKQSERLKARAKEQQMMMAA